MPTLGREREIDMRMKPLRAEVTAAHPLGMWHVSHDEDQNEVAKEIEIAVGEEPDGTERPWLAPDIFDFIGQREEVIIIHNNCIESLD